MADRDGSLASMRFFAGCRGPCEATGVVSVYLEGGDQRGGGRLLARHETDFLLRFLWMQVHESSGPHVCDGWHFVPCPQCSGRGLLPWHTRWRHIPYLLKRARAVARSHLFLLRQRLPR